MIYKKINDIQNCNRNIYCVDLIYPFLHFNERLKRRTAKSCFIFDLSKIISFHFGSIQIIQHKKKTHVPDLFATNETRVNG